MSTTYFVDFSNFDFWQLPFEQYGLFLDIEADKYGIAAAVVREALRGEGKGGKRKKRLLEALSRADEALVCREIAGIYRSALLNSKSFKSCAATECSLERNFCTLAERDDLFDLIEDFDSENQIAKEKRFLEVYTAQYPLYTTAEWAEVADICGVNLDRIQRVAALSTIEFCVNKSQSGQLAIDFWG